MKKWIEENLLTKTGKINTRKIMKNGYWLKINNLNCYNFIMLNTNFLTENVNISERIYCILNDIKERKKCKSCNKNVNFKTFQVGYNDFCSIKCLSSNKNTIEKRKETCLKKYGVDNPKKFNKFKNKSKETCLEKYGSEYSFQNKNIKEKIKETCLEKYGVEYISQSSIIKEKVKTTNNEKYGVDNPSQYSVFQEKRKQTNNERYGVDTYSQSEKAKEKAKKYFLKKYGAKTYKESFITNYEKYNKEYIIDNFINEKGYLFVDDLIKFYNVTQSVIYKFLKFNNIKYKTKSSKYEKEIQDFLSFYYIEYKTNDRKTVKSPLSDSFLELDLLLKEHNIAIEFNGLYWHCEKNLSIKYLHKLKTDLCKEKNIQLLHIFENEWFFKENICKSVILSKIGIFDRKEYARKCVIKEIDNTLKNKFLEDNHLQGKDKSSIKLGLFYDNELLSVMTFGKRKITGGKSTFELLRFCNKLNTQIIGGASKLFKHFLNNYEYEKITTYADLRYSDGKLYEKLGFELSHISKPNYWYFKDGGLELFHRVKFQKHILKGLLEKYDENLTEYENMLNNGYNRIFDCGNFVFKYYKYI